jgi:YD repeat-containing protein
MIQTKMNETARRRLSDPHFDMLGYVESHKNRPQVPMYEDNRITEFEGIKNIYDAAGCLIKQTRPDRTKLRLHYDGAYRLVYIEKTNPDGKQTKISYAYDAISRRVFKGRDGGRQAAGSHKVRLGRGQVRVRGNGGAEDNDSLPAGHVQPVCENRPENLPRAGKRRPGTGQGRR